MSDHKTMREPSRWVPMDDKRLLAAIGKLGEEAAELSAIISRIVIQGPEGVNPDTDKPNLQALMEEIADVRGLSRLVIDEFKLDESLIGERAERKRQHKLAWLRMLDNR